MKIQILFIFLVLLIFTSCTKEVDIKLPIEESKLVIEGYIELDKYPIVYLTKSKSYTDKIDSTNVLDYIGSVAKVSISNGDSTEILTLKFDPDQFPFYYFEGTQIRGEIGKKYKIIVELNGETYTSSTKITNPVSLNKYNLIPLEGKKDHFFINISFTDPTESLNYYKVYIKRLGKDLSFKPCYLSTFNDKGFNGEEFSFQVIRNYSSSFQDDDQRYFYSNESVMIKFCTIDKKTHDYWKNIEGLIAISANPFGLSTNSPISSFTNDALGIWCGLSSKYYLLDLNKNFK